MARRGNHHIGAQLGVVPHVDVGVVHQGDVEVAVDVLAEVDVVPAPVGVEGGLHVAALAYLRQHLLQQGGPLFLLQRPGLVEVVQPVQILELFRQNGIVHGQIQLAAVYFLAHTHLYSSRSSGCFKINPILKAFSAALAL